MSEQDGSSIGSEFGLSLSRRQILGALAVSGAAGASGAMLARDDDPFDGDPGGGGSPSDGGVVYPIKTNAGDHCLGEDDEKFGTVGSNAANWFHVGDCGSWKEYAVDSAKTYRIVAYADECLEEASFVIEEENGGDWETVRTVESDVSSTTNDQINDRAFEESAEDGGIRLRQEPTHEILHSPDSTKLRIRSTADWDDENEPGSYVTVFEWPLAEQSSSKRIGPDAYKDETVPGLARPRDDKEYLDPEHELFVERDDIQKGRYRFEYEGWGSQSVTLLRRDVTEVPQDEPWVLNWFELSSQFVTVRTDSPKDPEKWADGEQSYQFLPPTDEQLDDADVDLDHLRNLEPPMTIPTETIQSAGYEVRKEGSVSVSGYAERLAFNEPKPGLTYTDLVEVDPEDTVDGVVRDLIDIWEPTPDVPTTSGDYAFRELWNDDRFVTVASSLLGVGEAVTRYGFPSFDWAMNFVDSMEVLSSLCPKDTELTNDHFKGERELEVLTCDKGMGVQNVIVQVAHKVGDSGTVEFESTFKLGEQPDVHGDGAFTDNEVTFTHSFDLPPDVPRERDRPACFDEPRPAIAFDPEPPVGAGTVVTLDGSESTVKPDLSVHLYEWHIRPPRPEGVEEDPDHESHLAGETVEYEFQAEGTYEVELTVTDADGRTGTETVEFEVEQSAELTDDGAELEIEGAGRKKDHARADETITIEENAPLELAYDIEGSFERWGAGVSAFTRVVERPGTDDERVIFQIQRALRRDFEYRVSGDAIGIAPDGEGIGADTFDEHVQFEVDGDEARLLLDGEKRVSTEVRADYGGEIGIEYKVQIDKPNESGRVHADWSAVSLEANDESDESDWTPW